MFSSGQVDDAIPRLTVSLWKLKLLGLEPVLEDHDAATSACCPTLAVWCFCDPDLALLQSTSLALVSHHLP